MITLTCPSCGSHCILLIKTLQSQALIEKINSKNDVVLDSDEIFTERVHKFECRRCGHIFRTKNNSKISSLKNLIDVYGKES